ncbi:MazG-like family protein [Lysinibacillus sphaericus]|uniref:MazG-like family protein n=1 Tax=Lysinibacillus sphaericus TaxID=1421 RepID=UPI0018CDF972|nr:MazG-like family protein [Lysinibacillus sphaericus]
MATKVIIFPTANEASVVKDYALPLDELANVLIYAILFANETDMDLVNIIDNKLRKNNRKFPIEKFAGKNTKYNEI